MDEQGQGAIKLLNVILVEQSWNITREWKRSPFSKFKATKVHDLTTKF